MEAPYAPRKPRLRAQIEQAVAQGDRAIIEELSSNPSYRSAPRDVVAQLLVRSGVAEARAKEYLRAAELYAARGQGAAQNVINQAPRPPRHVTPPPPSSR